MSDWREVLAAVAPTLATALGGPLAGTAVAIIGRKLLGKDDATEDEIAQALGSASPETLLQIKGADLEFKRAMKELDIQDRQGARKLAIDTGIAPQVILSSIYTGGYFWLMGSLIGGEVVIAQDIQALVFPLIGVMSAAQIQIMNFWFGSSSGSKEKTKKLK
jgi:hypothetical protein